MNKPEPSWLTARLGQGGHAGLPKYLQLRDAVAGAVADAALERGARLPPEESLVRLSGFSLGTVQRALGVLVEDGLLVRKHGAGTFVAGREAPMRAPFYHCRFLDEPSGAILPIYSTVLGRDFVATPGPWRDCLRGAEHLRIERLFSINGEFAVYTLTYFERGLFPALEKVPLKKLNGANLKELLARDYHRPVTRFTETLSVAVIAPAMCKALKVARNSAGAVLEIIAHDRRGDAVYFQSLHIPPNPRRLVLG